MTSLPPTKGDRPHINAAKYLSSIEVTSYTRAGLHAALIEGQREARRVAVLGRVADAGNGSPLWPGQTRVRVSPLPSPVEAAPTRIPSNNASPSRVVSLIPGEPASGPLEQATHFRIPLMAFAYSLAGWGLIVVLVLALKELL